MRSNITSNEFLVLFISSYQRAHSFTDMEMAKILKLNLVEYHERMVNEIDFSNESIVYLFEKSPSVRQEYEDLKQFFKSVGDIVDSKE